MATAKKQQNVRNSRTATIIATVAVAVVVLFLIGLLIYTQLPYYADIEIEGYGTITVRLDSDAAPITVKNFVSLAKSGYYDGLTFHRIMENFMMQGGNGYGVPGKPEVSPIVGEFSSNGYDNPLKHTRGAISMARTDDKNSATSQFFIVHQQSEHLDGDYAAFGYVVSGMEIVDRICEESAPIDNNGTIAKSEQPVIKTVKAYRVLE